MKVKIIILIIILALAAILFFMFSNNSLTISNVSDFKAVYNMDTDLKNISIDVYDQGQVIGTITDTADIQAILDAIKNETIEDNVKQGETILGGAYNVTIKNGSDNSSVSLAVNDSQLSINNKTYSTITNIKTTLKPIMDKYMQ